MDRDVVAREAPTRGAPPQLAVVDRPRMRGRLHAYGFFAAVIGSAVLCFVAARRPGVAPVVTVSIYGLTACLLLGVSAIYHLRSWTRRAYEVVRRLDHALIFVFIAGTYAPFCVLLLPPDVGRPRLTAVCLGALCGVALKLVWPYGPRWLSAALYVGLGWMAVRVLPDMLRHGGPAELGLLVGGGVVYTLGAVCYALRRPNPWPASFGHHECFHACTLLGALCHHVAVYLALYE